MTAYYNEYDKFAAQWLRNLIAAGMIAPGDVDDRSITEVSADELKGYTQCHFFAGIGVWSYALRRSGWDDSRPVWTGSCPCQPFSVAGKGKGTGDARHLWPVFADLIRKCKPSSVFGEQVASKDADAWIDAVQDDLEAMGYAVGAVAFPSAGVGAPHIRDRMYWVGHDWGAGDDVEYLERDGVLYGRRLADTTSDGSQVRIIQDGKMHGFRPDQDGSICRMANADRHGCDSRIITAAPVGYGHPAFANGSADTTSPLAGFWRDADWLYCRDGKWRPVEPGTFPLAHGITSRVGRLRAYGNAINAESAIAFILAAMELMP